MITGAYITSYGKERYCFCGSDELIRKYPLDDYAYVPSI